MSAALSRVAVIGAGVMGSGIAAQIANAGIPVLLLDRGDIAADALAAMAKRSPAPFMSPRAMRLVQTADSDSALEQIADCDWIIEVIVERLDIKQALYRRIDAVRRPDAIVSSNTSTIPLAQLVSGMPEAFASCFVITHFFNPPRYMRLLELVSGPHTDPHHLARLRDFCDVRLGKTPVACHDTPGFIANRIGTYWMQEGLNAALDLGLTVEEADAAMGKPAGIPKTGIFGLLDLVGLDLMPHIVASLRHTLPPDDAFQATVRDWPVLQALLDAGHTGRKGDGGFYRLIRGAAGKHMLALDLATGAYRPQQKASITARDLASLLAEPGKIGAYARRVLGGTIAYAAALVPEIADDIVAIDDAMRLGYNWKRGPFEMIDAIGVADFTALLRKAGQDVPALLQTDQPFYRVDNKRRHYRGIDGAYHDIRRPEGVLLLADIKRASKPLLRNGSASLWDIGDGVACFEMTSKLGSFDPAIMELLEQTLAVVGKSYKALVIGHDGDSFSAGANLGLALFAANIAAWGEIEKMVAGGQATFKAMKYAPFPVVAAPAGLALGGGCEITLHADAVQAHAELYMGLVECGVGLIPGWGGCGELIDRLHRFGKLPNGPMPAVAKAFEQISTAAVSTSAEDAKRLAYLRPTDGITMNRDRLLADAKARALAMVDGYQPPKPPEFHLPGISGRVGMTMAADAMRARGLATGYDITVATALATVLSGGPADLVDTVSDADMLALERNAFLRLVRNTPTLARIEYTLATGKPLRN
jgi:3-hydroxyacyl-CoA dehydrogenase